jgi:hypothetical protein
VAKAQLRPLQGRGRVFGEDASQRGGEKSGIRIGKNERRTKLDDVVVGAVGAGEDAEIAETVDDVRGLLGGGSTRVAMVDEVEAEKETGAANITEKRKRGLQRFEGRAPARADVQSVLLETLVAKNIEDSKSGRTSDGIAAKGRKKLHAVGERAGDFGSGDDGGERKCVADGLTEYDDIWNDLLRFKSPKMSA